MRPRGKCDHKIWGSRTISCHGFDVFTSSFCLACLFCFASSRYCSRIAMRDLRAEDLQWQSVINRKLTLCPTTEGLAHGQLIKACPACSEFHLPCYCLAKFGDPFTPRHNFRIIFTDGACLNNGQHDATSGVGIAFGPRPNRQWFVPISDEEDPYHIRSNQRAELYAALSGLRCRADLAKTEDQASGSTTSDYGGTGRAHCASASSKRTKDLVSKEPWIIATDSEYVVKGMTEWLPAWKVISALRNCLLFSTHVLSFICAISHPICEVIPVLCFQMRTFTNSQSSLGQRLPNFEGYSRCKS